MVVGVIRPDEGAVIFKAQEITNLPMHRRARLGIGYLTQEPSIFRKLTVEQNILAILETCRMKRQERAVRLKYLLDELDLARLAKSKAFTLSGGEKRRLEITRALVTSPKLMLLDEPFGKLDAFTKMEVHSWLLNSWHQEKQTIVMVTHDLDEAILLSDRIFILSQRPASIVGEVQVKLPRPRTMDMLTSLELKKDKEEILSVLAPYMKK